MTAKEKLESLSHSWMGYAVCSTLFSIFGLRASGLVSFAVGFTLWAVINAVILAMTLALMMFFGRKLVAKSSGMRGFLIFMSGLCSILGVLSLFGQGRMLLSYWSVGQLVQIAATGIGVWMNVRSFGILNSSKVRQYFA